MKAIQVTNRIKIFKQDGVLLVEHELGDNFVLNVDKEIDIDTFKTTAVPEVMIYSTCRRGKAAFDKYKKKFQEVDYFIKYVYENQDELLDM